MPADERLTDAAAHRALQALAVERTHRMEEMASVVAQVFAATTGSRRTSCTGTSGPCPHGLGPLPRP